MLVKDEKEQQLFDVAKQFLEGCLDQGAWPRKTAVAQHLGLCNSALSSGAQWLARISCLVDTYQALARENGIEPSGSSGSTAKRAPEAPIIQFRIYGKWYRVYTAPNSMKPCFYHPERLAQYRLLRFSNHHGWMVWAFLSQAGLDHLQRSLERDLAKQHKVA